METSDPAKRRGFFEAPSGMPPWLPTLLRQIVAIVILMWALFHITRALRNFLVLLLIALFLSIAFEPAVAYLAKRQWSRGLATGAVFGGAAIVGALVIGLMVPVLINQVSDLIDNLPVYSEQLATFLDRFNIDVSQETILDTLGGSDLTANLGGRALGIGTVVVGTIFQGLTIALFTFYLTADAPRIRLTVLRFFPEYRQRELLRIQQIAIDKTGGYVYSRLLLAVVASLATWVALKIIGVEFAEPLALWVGVISQFVPVVGTYLGGVFPVLIALLDDPIKAIWVVVFIALYQQFENYIVSPRVTARTMSIHPAIAFGSAIIGATLLGAAGAIMALPVAATIQAWISTYFEYYEVVGESGQLRLDAQAVDHLPPPD